MTGFQRRLQLGCSWSIVSALVKEIATITVIGKDRTGLIARITGFLFAQRANIEEMEEQVSRGLFSMNLQASWGARDFDRAVVERGLRQLANELGMEVKVRFAEKGRRQRMAMFVTKEPHCAETVLCAIRAGAIAADCVVIISNRTDLKSQAADWRIPFLVVNWNDRRAAEKAVLKAVERYEVDFMALARFMKILSPNFVWRFKNKIINIHPSLLPAFAGASAYRQAYEKGVQIVGVTAHFVTTNLDEGPIIWQEALRVHPNESLESIVARGQRLESRALLRAIQLFLKKRLDVYWGKVHLPSR